MRILLTGASSFTGLWFAQALSAAGHEVTAPLRRSAVEYSGLRGTRVSELARVAEVVWDCPFGGTRFLELADGRWDLLCHHAAHVGNYRSPDFDVAAAVAENSLALPQILRTLLKRGLRGIVLTGSVFEQNEGAGDTPLRAFSPYGLSKGLTAQVFDYWCGVLGVPFGKFVIANPFGPFEEPRFCAYLVGCWQRGEVPRVRTPLYVRDNIHVSLLACAYAKFAERVASSQGVTKLNPSGYVESQGAFAQRFARELAPRLAMDCPLELLEQTEFTEPAVRLNTDRIDGHALGWSESAAWDSVALFYGGNADKMATARNHPPVSAS
ncbi:NAD-dependent epimerase/dehydratase family protein [Azospirillum lipoferum]|uniref:NAD-dependent epimerase/dehydratase domain-containing protein n=1 Tax=Azospirillum lipoferum (strain 4B) TaxID=862719 RepID=G7ZIM5_AZOL4|nr:NAD(P)-dependent oxidoreductase [Azospirillum lipoferum]CBS91500.1 conserved protein of unknown function; putative epimerase [Azospirillum lipoferum 4B]